MPGCSGWSCWKLTGEASVYNGLGVTIGHEDLPQVSKLLPLRATTACLLSSVLQTLDDASFDPGYPSPP